MRNMNKIHKKIKLVYYVMLARKKIEGERRGNEEGERKKKEYERRDNRKDTKGEKIEKRQKHNVYSVHLSLFISIPYSSLFIYSPPSSRCTVYVPQLRTWYDSRSHTEVLSSSVMGTVESSISTAGLTGVDKLLAFLIVTELQVIIVLVLLCLLISSITVVDKVLAFLILSLLFML